MIQHIGWKAALKTSFPATERVYLDPRGIDYAPVAGSPEYTLITGADNQPGSHLLTSGYVETLFTLPSVATVRIKAYPTFPYDTGTAQPLWGWQRSATRYMRLYYEPTQDTFRVVWRDGGTEVYASSQQFDDGTSFDNIAQWLVFDVAWDHGAGTVELIVNRVTRDTIWSGTPDAHVSRFAKFQIRADGNGTAGAYKVSHLRVFGYKATAIQAADDYRTVKAEEIFWPLNGEAVGRTRCNITRHVSAMSTKKSIADQISGQPGANQCSLTLHNTGGWFADDQYAVFDPTLDQFNGIVQEKYLQRRMRVWAETWNGNDFDTVFFGATRRGAFARTTPNRHTSTVSVTAEDIVSHIGRATVRRGRYYRGYPLCNPASESLSLVHVIARLATAVEVLNFLGNSGFENTTITDSWSATGDFASWSRVAGGFYDAYQGDLVSAGSVTTPAEILQVVTFTGLRRLSKGEVFTAWVWVQSSAAASGNLILEERLGSTTNASTQTAYSADANGWQRVAVTHTITDATSDRLRVRLTLTTPSVTLSVDDAHLITSARVLNFRVPNNTPGTAGVSDADTAASARYDRMGFDVDGVAINHPWRRVDMGVSLWDYLKGIAQASIASHLGATACGTLRFRSRLTAGYADPVQIGTVTAEQTALQTTLDVRQANKILVRGVRITLQEYDSVVWLATACDAFVIEGLALEEVVANGASWPPESIYGKEFVAVYGDIDSRVSPQPETVIYSGEQKVIGTWSEMAQRYL